MGHSAASLRAKFFTKKFSKIFSAYFPKSIGHFLVVKKNPLMDLKNGHFTVIYRTRCIPERFPRVSSKYPSGKLRSTVS